MRIRTLLASGLAALLCLGVGACSGPARQVSWAEFSRLQSEGPSPVFLATPIGASRQFAYLEVFDGLRPGSDFVVYCVPLDDMPAEESRRWRDGEVIRER